MAICNSSITFIALGVIYYFVLFPRPDAHKTVALMMPLTANTKGIQATFNCWEDERIRSKTNCPNQSVMSALKVVPS